MKSLVVLTAILLVSALLLGCAPKAEPPATPAPGATPSPTTPAPEATPSPTTPPLPEYTPPPLERTLLSAEFTISSLSVTPSEVKPGQPVAISAVVTNDVGSEETFYIVLNINSLEERTKSITIGAGKSQTIDFSVAKEKAGTYKVSIQDKVGQFTVSQ